MTHPLGWLALVALERAEMPSFECLATWYAEHFPEAPPPSHSASTENLLTVTLGEFTAAITLVRRQIPWSQLEGPAATAWYWPQAAAMVRDHQAHLLVTLIDEGGSAVKKAAALTRLTAAATATTRSAGVFWGPSRMVHAPDAFVDQALQMCEGNWPLFLWIDFRIEQFDDGAVRLYTTGLEALGQNEIEVPRFVGQHDGSSPQELLDYTYNIAHYVLEKTKVIRDGDTFGVTDQVQVTARREPSMLGGDMEVLRMEFERGS